MNPTRNSRNFKYILRYLIDPDFKSQERITELVEFCQRAAIEEVMLFVTAEELSNGHPTEKEIQKYAALGKVLRIELQKANIDLSLNPWSTTHHNMRGRTLHDGQNFRLMVGENGVKSSVTVCPLCPEWLAYLCNTFEKLVSEILPCTLWVEDDWRLRNHDSALGWGGCFCQEHLRLFSEQVGQTVDRKKLLETILRPGKPHPWRKLWLELSRQTLLFPLRKLAGSIKAASPETRVGLMSSNPDAHAAEGRSWPDLQSAIATDGVFLSRPNMGPYTQTHALQSAPNVARLTIANLKGSIEIYPELENSPRCGPFSKSRAFSNWQILNSAIIGSSGITINHYDMLGNGIALDPQYYLGLGEIKPVLNALAELQLDDRNARGVQVLFSPEIASHIELGPNQKMQGLSQNSRIWGDICSILGISFYFSPQTRATQDPILVNGQTLRAFSNAEIALLLRQRVVLDAYSIEVLLERGFQEEIGVEHAERKALSESAYSYEEIIPPDLCPIRSENARMSAQRCASWLLAMQGRQSALVCSEIKNACHESLFPGSIYYENRSGGKVLSLCYPLDGNSQFFMGFFNVFRQQFLQRILFRLLGGPNLAAIANPAMHAYQNLVRGKLLLAAVNPLDDPQDCVVWRMSKENRPQGHWETLDPQGRWLTIEPKSFCHGDWEELSFVQDVAPLQAAFFLFSPVTPLA